VFVADHVPAVSARVRRCPTRKIAGTVGLSLHEVDGSKSRSTGAIRRACQALKGGPASELSNTPQFPRDSLDTGSGAAVGGTRGDPERPRPGGIRRQLADR